MFSVTQSEVMIPYLDLQCVCLGLYHSSVSHDIHQLFKCAYSFYRAMLRSVASRGKTTQNVMTADATVSRPSVRTTHRGITTFTVRLSVHLSVTFRYRDHIDWHNYFENNFAAE